MTAEKRDSFIDSENESSAHPHHHHHRNATAGGGGDDSDAFADDEAPSSGDGFEERDDISLVSTVSSVGEDDTYLSEPTYNNLDPVWAQRHGFGPGRRFLLYLAHLNCSAGRAPLFFRSCHRDLRHLLNHCATAPPRRFFS